MTQDTVGLRHTLRAEHLRLAYDRREVVEDLSIDVPTGAVTMIIGPNGCGKSTLLRALARLLTPVGGTVYLDDRDITEVPNREVATVLGILPQSPVAPDGITVTDLVSRGRYPHQGWFRKWNAEDDEAVAHALAVTSTGELADRPVDQLSGGQRQRVWIAMALAQRTDLLLLDEPTTYLDLANQVELLDLLTDLNRRSRTTIAVVLHDLNLACRYADHLVAMRAGSIMAEGPPSEIITSEMIKEVFRMDADILRDPVSGTPMIVPIGRHHVSAAATPNSTNEVENTA
ncbi:MULTISPECIES: ABC transporter ATP-binding protein [Pseudonocardia]|uniref:Iron-dicitrate ABC transporter ATP-binding protein n=2 Tax=Pseudonocardia TaxID=1847 RepID=A0ABQ0RW63_9PSEU|nr:MULTISPECIES: ABC transporter ATP-binding protein [Pseudonocardia]OSY39654.1 putative siderophore transport system ATP-binding protein YusV [Pseudonocardia autotrophica]TDN72785.1 iron complex transport system ATP-binding protein [Pseudonocardia autotrophica]BBG03499.1 iron-dicitrate ABC transporter ATP-binding protein [Pseudonocardia autotrophica]GEC24919.1 iron-dicitrate ABC transporter ATP-binding protein [Pseudonocardia saturnea]